MQMAIPSFDRLMLEPDLLRQLIRGAKAGEAESFERLVSLHERRVLRLAQRLLLNREAARDAAQDVFIRLHKKIRSVAEDKELGPWLYRTTVNVCIDVMRRAKDEMPIDLVPEIADDCDNPERSAATEEQGRLVLAALKALSPKERQAIVLRDLEGYSTAEAAKILGSTETTVRSQISTGRVKMKDFLVAKIGREL
jgi:RNA polymerase sigma-70 factor (ECF subfamily)